MKNPRAFVWLACLAMLGVAMALMLRSCEPQVADPLVPLVSSPLAPTSNSPERSNRLRPQASQAAIKRQAMIDESIEVARKRYARQSQEDMERAHRNVMEMLNGGYQKLFEEWQSATADREAILSIMSDSKLRIYIARNELARGGKEKFAGFGTASTAEKARRDAALSQYVTLEQIIALETVQTSFNQTAEKRAKEIYVETEAKKASGARK